MDDHWHYAESADHSYGPMTIEELGRVLRTRANSADFLVWRPGMSNWGRAGDQFALSRYLQPPPIARQSSVPMQAPLVVERDDRLAVAAQESHDLHPWRRYFARAFDLYFFYLFFFFFLGLVVPELFSSSEKGMDAVYAILGSGAYAVFESFSLNVFGTSLGKKLYGIRLMRTSEEGFPLPIAFKRSFAVWVRGLGFGIPLATLITLIVAYRTLSQERQTSWDRDFQCAVAHSKLSALRWIWILCVWFLMLGIYVGLLALGKT